MGLVKMYSCTQEKYNSLETKDFESLYFISDSNVVYKGDSPYSGKINVVDALPALPAQGSLYILSTDGIGRIWTGVEWEKITYPVLTDMPVTPDNNAILTAKAISDFVTGKVNDVVAGDGVFVTDVTFLDGIATISKGNEDTNVPLTGMAKTPAYNTETRTITIPVVGKSDVVINLGRDLVITGGKYNAPTAEIWLSIAEGGGYDDAAQVIKIPVGNLVDIYTGNNTATAKVSVVDNEVSVDVNISETANNALTGKADGLYVDISGKADKVATGKTGEIVTADATGNITASGKKAGGATLAGTTDVNTLATEKAVEGFVNSIKLMLQSDINSKVATASIEQTLTGDLNKIPSSAAVYNAISWKTL